MTEVTATNHLSIGEVLSLVQEDFPDVTISKIRFLESQGLIAPERTGSGYRKFYSADIERLRWILRQQRDNFLPLKVIKKMLDDGVDLSGTMETQPTLWASTDDVDEESSETTDPTSAPSSAPPRPAGAARGTEGEATVERATPPGEDADDLERAAYRSPSHPAVASAAPKRGSQRRSSGSTGNSGAPGNRSAGDASPSDRATNTPSGGAERTAGTSTGASATPASGSNARRDRPDRTEASDASSTSDRRRSEGSTSPPGNSEVASTRDTSGPERPAHSTPADVVAALQEDPRSARKRRQKAAAASNEPEAGADSGSGEIAGTAPAAATPAAGPETPGLTASIAAGTSPDALLSAEEMCETAGISAELLADLEQYGLVVAASLGGRSAYDSEAVDVARMAAKYAELGVEPRHLRMYKVSAEREAGFVEQLVVPLIKQRNPAARQLAVDRCDELIAMGTELHASLLRRQLRRIIGG